MGYLMECEDKNCKVLPPHYHCSECGSVFMKKSVKEMVDD